MKRGCEVCGYRKHPSALTFDHINPEEKYRTKTGNVVHISDMVKGNRYSMKTILKEIDKPKVITTLKINKSDILFIDIYFFN